MGPIVLMLIPFLIFVYYLTKVKRRILLFLVVDFIGIVFCFIEGAKGVSPAGGGWGLMFLILFGIPLVLITSFISLFIRRKILSKEFSNTIFHLIQFLISVVQFFIVFYICTTFNTDKF